MRLMGTADDVTGPVNLGNPVEFTIRQLAPPAISATTDIETPADPMPSEHAG
jgi:UDP-glucuronate decarboxylase